MTRAPLSLLAAAAGCALLTQPAASQAPRTGDAQAQSAGVAQARRILERTPLIDGHNDLPWAIREKFASKPERVNLRVNQSGEPRGCTRTSRACAWAASAASSGRSTSPRP
jgi:membrane dipeptidase